MPQDTMTPLGAESVSLGLYRHASPSARESVELAMAQARLAERCGFDGVTFSEHHLGHPDYFPNPLLMSAFVLGHTSRVWAGSLPMLLTLRSAATVVEDAAWIAALYTGRLVLGVAAGNDPAEFALGESPDGVVDCFVRRLATLSGCLVGRDAGQPVTKDPAVAETAGHIPIVSAARSRTAVRRAARLGLGILHSPVSSPERLAAFTDEYLAAGGRGPRVLIAPAWLDDPAAPGASAPPQDHASAWTLRGNANQIADALRELVAACRADAVNVRLHEATAGVAETNTQIEMFGAEVLPDVRSLLRDQSTSAAPAS